MPSITTPLAQLLTVPAPALLHTVLTSPLRQRLARPSITTPLAWLLTMPATALLHTLLPSPLGQRFARPPITTPLACHCPVAHTVPHSFRTTLCLQSSHFEHHMLSPLPCLPLPCADSVLAALEQRFVLLVHHFRSSLPLMAMHCCSCCAPQLQDNALSSVSPGKDCSGHHVDCQRDQQGPVRPGAGGGELREGAA